MPAYPRTGGDWFRWIEQRVRTLERHTHPDARNSDPSEVLLGDLQDFLAGGGIRTCNSTGVSWSSPFLINGMGRSPEIASGSLSITKPADGTTIPIHGDSSFTSTVVGGGTVPVSLNRHLYYDLPLGGEPSTGFHLVAESAGSVVIPRRWVRIVSRQDTPHMPYRWGDARLQDYPRAPSMLAGWVDYGTGYDPVRYWKEGSTVRLEGLMRDGAIGSAAFILPAGYRPPERYLFATITGGNVVGRLDVFANGEVKPQSGGTSYHSLSSVEFRYVQ